MSISLTGATATTIDKYVGRAESAVREDVAASTSPDAAAGTTARVNDIVSLADKADTLFFTYGSDARYQSITQAVTSSLSDKTLASYGNGKDLTVTDAKTSTTQATLENGTVRTTETTTNLATYDYTKADDNGGQGQLHLYRELVINSSDGNAKAGAGLAATTRVEQNDSTYVADAANKTLTITANVNATTTNSSNSNVTTEQSSRVTVFRLTDDGKFEQTVRERFFSTTTDASGALVSTQARESTTVNTFDQATGTLTTQRSDDTVNGSVAANGTVTTAGTKSDLTVTVNAQDGKVGDVKIKENLQNTVSTQKTDGYTQVSETNRTTTYAGVGQKAVSANTSYAGAASWVKADGSVGAGANSTGANFTLNNATAAAADVTKAGANGYAASGGTTATGDVEIRAQADVVAYTAKKGVQVKLNEDVKQVTIKADQLAVQDNSNGKKAADKFAAQSKQADKVDVQKLAATLDKGGVDFNIVDGKVVIGATNAKGKGPVAVVDAANNVALAQIGNRGYAKADGLTKTLQASRTEKANGMNVDLNSDTITNVEKNSKKRGYLAIQANSDGFAIGSKTGNKVNFKEVSPLRALTV